MCLKSRPEAGEPIVAYATILREKAHGCDFGSSHDDRILEHLIQTINNQYLYRNMYIKGGRYQFLTEAKQIKNILVQAGGMKMDQENIKS